MNKFKTTVVNTWGDQGRNWLARLAELIAQLSRYWDLSDIRPIDNMSYNYVVKAEKNNAPVVLKLSCDKQLIEDEYKALNHFAGLGAIKVIDINKEYNALLLEQAIPGSLLKAHHPINIADTITIYADVVKALKAHDTPSHEYTHVRKWCQAIDRIHDKRIHARFIAKAKNLRDFLLSSSEREYLCHGDLHLENIIQQGNKWLSIDPKGIIGEVAFEASAFDLIDKSEWAEPETIQDKIVTRIKLLANALKIDKGRLTAWIFLRVIISVQWFIEDNGDPNEILNLAYTLYPLLAKQYCSDATIWINKKEESNE